MSEIPVAPVVRILKAAGAERISDDAKKAFADAVEASAEVLAKKAIKAAAHADLTFFYKFIFFNF